MYNDNTGLFNIHELENDSTKVLVEIDIPTLMIMSCCWGDATDMHIDDIMHRWGFTMQESKRMRDDEPSHQYSQVKQKVIEMYKKYIEKQDEIPF